MSKKRVSLKKSPSLKIEIRGARQHNLKGLDLDLPLNQFTVVTGPSGAGKSSLAFHTLYAEGQRRYVETFSPYIRQFFDRMDKPAVESISNIPPTIAIEQKNTIRSSRSTVGTLTDINDYLKLLYPRLAVGYHPKTGESIRPATPARISAWCFESLNNSPALITFSISTPPDVNAQDFLAFLQSQGYLRILLSDGSIHRTDEPFHEKETAILGSQIQVIADRIQITSRNRSRLQEAIESALHHGQGTCTVSSSAPEKLPELSKTFTTSWHPLQEPTPSLFSFNSPHGACSKCRGFGRIIGIDLKKAIPDPTLSISQNCVKPFQGERGDECQQDLVKGARKAGINLDRSYENLSQQDQDWILYGEDGDTQELWEKGRWYGVKGFFDWLESQSYKMHVRVFLSRYRAYTLCPDCRGKRLQPLALQFKIGTKTLPDLWQMTVRELIDWITSLDSQIPNFAPDKPLSLILSEVSSRLGYLAQVGLGYLTLDRAARTLSGGEIARVNLTSCLGASLANTLFILDEPTIGLHPRDTEALIRVIKNLRDRGNTLLVVEHDEAVIRAADHLLDLGPTAGENGGHLCYQGSPEAPASRLTKSSPTLAYLHKEKAIPLPPTRRITARYLDIKGATCHNLKNLDSSIPLDLFCCITGVSGSGKSTLVHNVLYLNLAQSLGQPIQDSPSSIRKMTVTDGKKKRRVKTSALKSQIASVTLVDQTPISRTPRSSPAVFSGAFECIRRLFILIPEAQADNLTPGYFSFNSGTGRCDRCLGNGFEKIEMQFLSDLYLSCPECNGSRYNRSALQYRYQNQSISDILNFTIKEYLDISATWNADPQTPKKEQSLLTKATALLAPLKEVGLDYLKLGQPLNTLSGGEAQRVKLAALLASAATTTSKDNTHKQLHANDSPTHLLILDEPTTGLHFSDVEHLLTVFQRLVNSGHSLLVIEHNLDVIKTADFIIDLGPEAGMGGGEITAVGTPAEIAKTNTHTGRYLKPLLRTTSPKTKSTSRKKSPKKRKPATTIRIHGARHHNLKNIDLAIPRDEFVVITGLSGSGKSTIAFDIVFAEGQRRFLDSMSPYARQFAEQFEKPDLDTIEGLPPTVAIEQRISRGGQKSTVATVTEIYHFLRLLYAKVGTQYCPESGIPLTSQTEDDILHSIKDRLKKQKSAPLKILAPLIRGRKGYHTEIATWAERHGYSELLVDQKLIATADFKPLARYKEHDIDLVLGSLTSASANLPDIISQSLKIGKNSLRILLSDGTLENFSTALVSPTTGHSFTPLEPSHFSFNSPRGWCPDCRGYGTQKATANRFSKDHNYNSEVEAELAEERSRFKDDDSQLIACPTCRGARLRKTALAVGIPIGKKTSHLSDSTTLSEITDLSVIEAAQLIPKLTFAGRKNIISRDIIPEITQRLQFLVQVGLSYLQLDRSANTLSGGEAQRIRLAAQLGSNLRGVLYVLDEPTIGLHPRDNLALLDTLESLRAKGNSLLVVEHDEETINRASRLIHLGPGAGHLGGKVVFEGTPSAYNKKACSKKSPLANPDIPLPTRRPLPARKASTGWLRLKGCTKNNLKNITIQLPLNRLTVITGVSGCGKSSFMRGTLKPAAQSFLSKKSTSRVPDLKSKTGFKALNAVYEVDQSPIGKTSRSCPATYVKALDEIRKLFAQLPEARLRGFTASRFSFNNASGQCPDCKGNGRIKLEMDFLPTTTIPCEACRGFRYNPSTLEIKYAGHSIGDILQMPIEKTTTLFTKHPRLHQTLNLLTATGLGYLQLGQPSPTLSGGEAQRLKLVSELAKGRSPKQQLSNLRPSKKGNLYLIEEPTIGLHKQDVAKLVTVLHRLVDEGHTVIVIEHNMDLAAQADYLLDFGPEAGAKGGTVVAHGTPEKVARSKKSRTAPFLISALSTHAE